MINKDVKLIIRDDDMNFFTKVEDIESVCSQIENFPISFAVIPCILRAKDNLPYPNIMQYSSHKKLNACALEGYDYLVRMFNYCKKIESPMAVNVHYWHLRDFPMEQVLLADFVKYAIDNGAVPFTMPELMKD